MNRALTIDQAGIPWLARLAPEPEPVVVKWIPYDVPLWLGVRGAFARLVLPQKLDMATAERLCTFIRALAFTDEELTESA